MKEMASTSPSQAHWRKFINAHVVWVYVIFTVLLSIAVILLPLPLLAGPALAVFIPTLIAALLIRLTEGKG